MRKITPLIALMALVALLLGINTTLAQANAWNLQVTATTSTTIEVSWSFPSGVTQALVTLRDADGNQLNAFGPLFSTSRILTGLRINTTYRISVAQLGDATNSAEITARTGNSFNVRVTRSTTSSISLAWNFSDDEATFDLSWVNTADSTDSGGDSTNTTSYTITGLTADNEYEISLSTTISANTVALATIRAVARNWTPPKKGGSADATVAPPTPRPAVNTCPNLLPDIVISGYATFHSQCQVVDAGGVGRMDLVERGIVAAVDIWYYVPQAGVGVCFRNSGAQVVFLDAAYSPRRLSTLNHLTLPNGMTCAVIHSAGTVVLLAS